MQLEEPAEIGQSREPEGREREVEETEREERENDQVELPWESGYRGWGPGKEEGVADRGPGAGGGVVGWVPDQHNRVSTAAKGVRICLLADGLAFNL